MRPEMIIPIELFIGSAMVISAFFISLAIGIIYMLFTQEPGNNEENEEIETGM